MFVLQELVGSVLDRRTRSFKGLAGTVFAEVNLSEAQWETAVPGEQAGESPPLGVEPWCSWLRTSEARVQGAL